VIPAVEPVDAVAITVAEGELDAKTKPRGSLGRLEALAAQLAGIAAGQPPPVRATVVVAAADHGWGVSAYPAEVTRQMALNFASGGAAVSVLAREVGAELVVVDAGIREPVDHPAVRALRFGPGTADATRGPAMREGDAYRALLAGVELAEELVAHGATAIALGEMGIGNTTSAAALHAALLGADVHAVCGPGTGLDDSGMQRKRETVARALDANRDALDDPLRTLAALGGFEIAFLVGVALGAAAARAVVVLDGFIVGAAALVAARLRPEAIGFMVAAHRSPEPGHALALEALGLRPLLDLELRLGEGTGAVLALPLLRAARAILVEMATFAAAGVTDAGR
jgi:nicotinate-nucleotide--dimethylbenzimidazole phosphoribosyltransferase